MSKFLKFLVLSLAVAFPSCQPTGKPMTPAEKAVETLAENLASAISRQKADEAANLFGRTEGTLYIDDGVVVPRQRVKATFEHEFEVFLEMDFSFEKKRTRVLNPDAAVFTGWAHYLGVRKDGQKIDEHAIFTILCLRRGDNWGIFQVHKSPLLSYPKSETSKARPRLSKFCRGNGIDLGYGGDPIVPSTITLDLPIPYTKLGDHPQNLAGDARDLYWFKDNVLDYVYSSHLLEDFSPQETAAVIREWLRVIKLGGVLVLYGPDEQAYQAYCRKKGQVPNPGHKIDQFGLRYVKKLLEDNFRGQYSILHEIELIDGYCFDLVVEKLDQEAH
ncbi:MAG: methyltransferase domain-containing protein [Candidatus Aminicenantes bacterium]|nr:methyltransferase domain-containing protein [Candidatus Aminicenantes bacterium]